MADNLNDGDEFDSTIVADHNKSSKNTNAVLEYEAPHFFDFNKMDDQSNHDGDDNYFLKNYEYNDESIKEKFSDESLYQTPESKLDKTLLPNFSSKYNLRETPLRRLYKQKRLTIAEFGKQKNISYRKSRKSVHNSKKNDDNDDDEINNTPFNMAKMVQVLDQVQLTGDQQVQSQQEEMIPTEPSNNNEDDENSIQQNSNEINDETMDGVSNITNDVVVVEDLSSETEQEQTIDNFHEISSNELKEPAQSNDQSCKRHSYLVKSPIVRLNDDEKESSTNVLAVSHDVDVMIKTPSTLNVDEEKKLKIEKHGIINNKNKNDETVTKSKPMVMNISKDRSKKYWKRFSRTLNQYDANNDKKELDHRDKQSTKNVNLVIVDKENRESVTPKSKEVTEKTMSIDTINRLTALPKRNQTERPSQKFVSMAEQTQRFLNSSRQYQPKTLWQRHKLTIPRSPLLLTEIRSKSRRRIETESNRVQSTPTTSSSSSLETNAVEQQ
ncbi:hypothetical protein DERF_009076 [Dermatophagoides farinae]|uniref:Uncharacterized protein n=1 Tax=Dermatophagoides farinae TaxID=6954 RepID=A0A922HX69_DERFA|nr:hypothetical protein DERF_009076 [Dermatophagoides farinae]